MRWCALRAQHRRPAQKAIEGLDDDTAVQVGAVATGVLPDLEFEALLQAVGEGSVERLAPGGGVAPALVLLIGLSSVDQSDREVICPGPPTCWPEAALPAHTSGRKDRHRPPTSHRGGKTW